jgi:hypothetical protein
MLRALADDPSVRLQRGEQMGLKEAILEASSVRGIDPYRQPFKPADLGIIASDYGSFSDYCSKSETQSGKWNKEVILEAAEWTRTGKPYKYILKK